MKKFCICAKPQCGVDAAPESLTPREVEVLQLIALGHCNKGIARLLGISVETVKTHVKNILAKLGAKARTHAVALATCRGLVRNAQNVA